MVHEHDEIQFNAVKTMVYVVADDLRHQPLVNFATHYRELKGCEMSDEVVNMVLKQVSANLYNTYTMVVGTDAFLMVYRTVQRQGEFSHEESWRLANAFCQVRYGFGVSYRKWLLGYWRQRLLG